MSIRLKLILSICVPLIVGYALVLIWDYQRSYQRAVEWSEGRVAERAAAAAAQVNERLVSVQQIADTTAAALTSRPLAVENQVRGALLSSLRPHAWMSGIWLTFDKNAPKPQNMPQVVGLRRGGALPQMIEADALDLDSFTWFARAKEWSKGAWTEASEIDQRKNPHPVAIYASPFYSGDQFAGVVAASVELESLQYLKDDPFFIRRTRRGEDRPTEPPTPVAPSTKPAALAAGGFFLIDTKGNLISHPDGVTEQAFLTHIASLGGDPFTDAARKAVDGAAQRFVTHNLAQFVSGYENDERYIVAMQPVPATRWVLVTAVLQSEMLGGVHDQLLKRAGLLALTMVMLMMIVLVVAKRFCRPIEKMARRVEAIGAGNLDQPPIPVKANDEIGRLAAGFNRMTEQLRRQFAAIEKQTSDREKVEGELRIARQIQIDLLPRTFPPFPDRSDFDLHATNVPARMIAGDFFDFFLVDPDKLVLVIADVSGKGIPAALVMAVTRTIVRNLANEGLSPLQIVQRTNRRLVADSTTGMFVTMILAEYQPSTGKLTYVNAGHPPAVRYGQAEPAFCCHSTGPLVGVTVGDDLGPTQQHEITIARGEGLIFYTDGVTEARDTDNQLFGDRRLLETSHIARTRNCEDACDAIVKRVMDYQQNQSADDVTVLLLRRL